MKKYNYTFLAIIILLSTYGIQHFQKDKRLEYVEFINKDLQNIRHSRAANENYKNIKEGKSPDQPEMAALQDYYQTMDPVEHRVPQERLLKAYQQTQEMRKAHHQKYNEDLQWENIPSNMGGRTRAIMWDPNSASGNGVWAGAVTGGIWHNEDITDANSQWEAVDDFMASLSISSLCYDPNNSTTFYAGTGEAPTAIITYRESSGRGLGIWKSTDSGTSWSLLESTQDFAYITDANYIPGAVLSQLLDCKVIVLNALRKRKHLSHYNLEEAVGVLKFLRPEKAYITHISHLMGLHKEVNNELPDFIELAYDGLQIEV
jgi:hypothetical protein